MFSLTIQDNHLSCRKQLRESSQLPEVLQKVRDFTCVVYEALSAFGLLAGLPPFALMRSFVVTETHRCCRCPIFADTCSKNHRKTLLVPLILGHLQHLPAFSAFFAGNVPKMERLTAVSGGRCLGPSITACFPGRLG